MRILVLADLSGKEGRGTGDTGGSPVSRRLLKLDVDEIDAAIGRLAPELTLSPGGTASQTATLKFSSFDDFHPDRIYANLGLFDVLRRAREKLLDPSTFVATAGALGGGPQKAETDAATLERLLGRPASPAAPRVDISALLRQAVGPYIVPRADPRQQELIQGVDDATSALMRAILHDPSFQALEASWRCCHWLVSRIETGEELAVRALDVTRSELAADFRAAGGDPGRSGLRRLLVDGDGGAPGGSHWSLIVGDFTFSSSAEDLELLAALGDLASAAGGPFLAGADPGILGCTSPDQLRDPALWRATDPGASARWSALRGLPAAPWIGRAMPRMLMRLPYGVRGEALESFPFEEVPDPGDHGSFLWGNPAFGCAMLIASSFQRAGWEMEPGADQEIDDLPACAYTDDGESKLKPCAEILLSERASEGILQHGIMPLMSYANRNAARVMRFQSVADPPSALAGPWGR